MVSAYLKDDSLNYLPVVKAVVHSPLKKKVVELAIDTGFQGGILIPLRTYVELGFNLFEEPKVIAQTAVGGKVELRASKALIEIDGFRTLCSVYTTLGVRKSLLGREVLRKIGLLYKPPTKVELEP